MVSNRAGGVSLRDKSQAEISVYLTRRISNVNWDKGLPNRLDDSSLSRTEFLLSFLGQDKYSVLPTKKAMTDILNDPYLIFDPSLN